MQTRMFSRESSKLQLIENAHVNKRKQAFTNQYPIGDDVSFFSRCEAAFSNLTWTPICLEPQQPDTSTFESLSPAIHEPPKLI